MLSALESKSNHAKQILNCCVFACLEGVIKAPNNVEFWESNLKKNSFFVQKTSFLLLDTFKYPKDQKNFNSD